MVWGGEPAALSRLRGEARSRVAPLFLITLVPLVFGCEPEPTLYVELRTNLHAGLEFTSVETEVYPGGGQSSLDLPQIVSDPRSFGLDAPALDGVRVASFPGLLPGNYIVHVILFDASGAEVADGLKLLRFDGTRVVPVVVHRECRGVSCPAEGSPTEIACLGGRCVHPGCPEDPSLCPEPECEHDSECESHGPSCVRGVCLARFCVEYPDDSSCPSPARCYFGEGCASVSRDAGARDAGTDAEVVVGPPPWMDAGTDAGFDAGSDAGTDAGFDAGMDAGFDAGFDAGTDAGPSCTTNPLNMSLRMCRDTTSDIINWVQFHYGLDNGSAANRAQCQAQCTRWAEAAGVTAWCCDLVEDRTTGTSWSCGAHRTVATRSYSDPNSAGSYAGFGSCR